MELRHYLEILERRKWIVLFFALAAFVVVALGTLTTTPVYSSSAVVRIAEGHDGAVSYSEINYMDRLLNTYAQLLKSRPFLEQAGQRLDLQLDPDSLLGSVKVDIPANTELLRITVESPSPTEAMAVANALATLLVEERQKVYMGYGKPLREVLQEQLTAIGDELSEARARLAAISQQNDPNQAPRIQELTTRIATREQTYNALLTQYDKARLDEATRANSISVVEPALLPSSPAKPKTLLYLVLGTVVGVLGGIGLAFAMDNLDHTFHSARAVEGTGDLPILGWIPRLRSEGVLGNGSARKRDSSGTAEDESFRILSLNALRVASGSIPRVVLITSAEAGAGRSTVAARLAAALAGDGRRVILVDCDLERPSIHSIFELPNEQGLVNAVKDVRLLTNCLQDTAVPGLRVVTRGPRGTTALGRLELSGTRNLIQLLGQQADALLLDGPPVLSSADAAFLSSLADGVVLVIARDHSKRDGVEHALKLLNRAGGTVLGIAFNEWVRASSRHYLRSSSADRNHHEKAMPVVPPV